MENKKPQLDKSKLSAEQRDKLDLYEATQQQLASLSDIADMTQEIVGQLDEIKKSDDTENIGKLLMDMRESLSSLSSKEAPEAPDTAKPVVEAVARLEKALTAAIKAIDVQPTVEAPQVNVGPPSVNVDLKGVEKAVSGIPKAFSTAISSLPKVPKPDYAPLLKSWKGISEQLVSIENATRSKPAPGNTALTLAGSPVSEANPLPVNAEVNVVATIDPDGLALAANQQTDALTDTQLRATPVPVSGAVSVSGVSTTAKQDTGNASLASIDGKITAVNTGAVVVASSALPSGAATSAKQDTGNTSLSSIDGKLTDVATQTTLALIKAKTDNLDIALSTRTKPADQQHTIVDSSALPAGASTSAKQLADNHNVVVTSAPTTAVTGAVTANAGTNLNTSALATSANQLFGLMPKVYDYINADYSASTADVYTYKAGGSGGTTAATLTVNWTDATKLVLSTVIRT